MRAGALLELHLGGNEIGDNGVFALAHFFSGDASSSAPSSSLPAAAPTAADAPSAAAPAAATATAAADGGGGAASSADGAPHSPGIARRTAGRFSPLPVSVARTPALIRHWSFGGHT